jgi:hypothetical protein
MNLLVILVWRAGFIITVQHGINRRDAAEGDRVNALLTASNGKRLTYQALIA